MVKEDLSNSQGTPIPNEELTKNKYHIINYFNTERVPEKYTKLVLVNYFRGQISPQVIDYILNNGGFTIPTLGCLFDVSYQTIGHILKRLRPWVIQTNVRLEHPIKKPGNKPYVWIREGIDIDAGVKEAEASYYSTLRKYDPSIKLAEDERMDREKQKEDLGRSFLEDVVKDHHETHLRDILTYLRMKGIGGTLRRDLANMIAELVKESGVKVWR